MAINAVAHNEVSIALACRTFRISETCNRYSPVLSNVNEDIADWPPLGDVNITCRSTGTSDDK